MVKKYTFVRSTLQQTLQTYQRLFFPVVVPVYLTFSFLLSLLTALLMAFTVMWLLPHIIQPVYHHIGPITPQNLLTFIHTARPEQLKPVILCSLLMLTGWAIIECFGDAVSLHYCATAIQRTQTCRWKSLFQSIHHVSTRLITITRGILTYWSLVGLGSLLFFIPGAIFGILFLLMSPALILEDKRVFEAMRCSYRWIRGYGWRIAWTMLLPFTILILIHLFTKSVIFHFLISMLIHPFIKILILTLYNTRKKAVESQP